MHSIVCVKRKGEAALAEINDLLRSDPNRLEELLFTVIAHRGFRSQAPENTLAAFGQAVDAGFDNIELDVQLTKDDVVVVFHDASLERTTDGAGLVADHNVDYVQGLDAGSWFDSRYSDQRVPTFEEVLEAVGARTRLHVELKSEQPGLVAAVHAVLGQHQFSDAIADPFAAPGITFTSFHVEQLEKSVAQYAGLDVPHHWLVDEVSSSVIKEALSRGFSGVCPPSKAITVENAAAVFDAGLTLRAWDVAEVPQLMHAVACGATGATFSAPDLARTRLSAI